MNIVKEIFKYIKNFNFYSSKILTLNIYKNYINNI